MKQLWLYKMVKFTLEAEDPSETGVQSQRNNGMGQLIHLSRIRQVRTLKHESEAGVDKIHYGARFDGMRNCKLLFSRFFTD